MRVTQSMLVRTALADIARQRTRLASTQEKASSGLDINRPSDDPAGASAALLLRSAIGATEQMQRNVIEARNRVEVVESALARSNDVLIRARELALQGANETQDAQTRSLIAREVEGLFGELLSEANVRSGGSYLFAGHASTTEPLVASGPFPSGPPAPTVSFAGDSNEIQVPLDQGITVTTTLDGRRVFLGDADGDGTVDGGREDLFAVLGSLRDALLADDPVGVRATLDRIDAGIDQVSEERARLGVADGRIAGAEDRLAERLVQLEKRLSDTQDADAAEVFSDLVNQEAALRGSLDAAGRLVQPTLLDFLR